MFLTLCAALLLPLLATAAPSSIAKSASFAASASVEDSGSKPLLSFDHGNVGVNFMGYHASAGLGGLLTGNLADGGLHAEAGTPHGQNAAAGLGGAVDASGNRAGFLYSRASDGVNNPVGALLRGFLARVKTEEQ